jgi:hypothetical protein
MSSMKMGTDQQHGLEGAFVAQLVVALSKGIIRLIFWHPRCPDSGGFAFRLAVRDSSTPSNASARRGAWREVAKISTKRPAPAEVITMARNRDDDFSSEACGGIEALAGSPLE